MNQIDITALDATKIVANIVIGGGVTKIVHGIIANNTVPPEKALQKLSIGAASVVAGMMAKDASKTYVNKKIDGYVSAWKRVTKKIEESKEDTTKDQ